MLGVVILISMVSLGISVMEKLLNASTGEGIHMVSKQFASSLYR